MREENMRKCSEFSEFYTDYIDGALNEEMRAEFDAHLNICPDCVKQLESFKSVITTLHELPIEPLPDDFNARLLTRLHVEKRRKALWFPALGVAVAAMVIGMLMVQNPVNKPGEELAYNNSRQIEKKVDIPKKSVTRENETLAGSPAAPAKVPTITKEQGKSVPVSSSKGSKAKVITSQKPGMKPMKIAGLPKDMTTTTTEPSIAMYDNKSMTLSENQPPIINKNSVDNKIAFDPGEIKSNNLPKAETYNDNNKSALDTKDATISVAMAPGAVGGTGTCADAMPAMAADKKDKTSSSRKFEPANGMQMPSHAMMSTTMAAEPTLLMTDVAGNKITVKINNKTNTVVVNEQNELVIDKTNYILINQNNKLITETGVYLQKAAIKEKVVVLLPTELVQKKLLNNVNDNNGLRAIAASMDAEIYFYGKFVTILPKNPQ
jgi:hypothetical protein